MNGIDIKLNGEGAWPELKGKKIHHVKDSMIGVAVLPHGMQSGKPSIMIRIDLPDGSTVVAETSLRLLLATAEACVAAYGHQDVAGMQFLPGSGETH